jgi:hypothetical protein
MSNIVRHAKRELALLGYIPLDEEQEDGPDKVVQKNILELVELFQNQHNSADAASYIIGMFFKLSKIEPLRPLTGEDSEWEKVDFQTWQNIRCSRVFKKSDGTCFDVEGRIFEKPDGARFTSTSSCTPVTFPYLPKTEVVKLTKEEFLVISPSQLQ